MRDLIFMLMFAVLLAISTATYSAVEKLRRADGWDQIERARLAPDAAPGGSQVYRKVNPSNG